MNRWLYLLMPSVKIKRVKDGVLKELIIPLIERWEEVNEQINKDTPQAKKHREKLFGNDSKIKTGELFGEIALCKRDGMPEYHVFKSLPIRDRARYIAFATLDSIKEIVERHEALLKENAEAQIAKQRSANKGKRKRR